MDARYVGHIGVDDFIVSSINNRQPYIETYSESKCAREVAAITHNLMDDQQMKI